MTIALCRIALEFTQRQQGAAGLPPVGPATPAFEVASLAAAFGLPSAEAALRAYAAHDARCIAPPLRDCVPQFLTVKKAEGCRAITLSNYRGLLQRFASQFGHRQPATLSPLEIADYLNQWDSPTTRGVNWLRLREFYRWIVGVRYAWTNPLPAAMSHALPLGHRGLHFTPDEARFVLQRTIHTDQIGYWVLALFSGLRTEEIQRLSQHRHPWSWFNRGTQMIDVPAYAAKVRHRLSPMHPVLLPWLDWLWRENRPFWPRDFSKALGRTRREVVARRLGVAPDQVPARYNRLGYSNMPRRSFISYGLALRGASYAEVARRAGNSEGVIRKYYRREVTRREAEAYFSLTPGQIMAAVKGR